MKRLTDHENEHYNQPGCNSCSDYRWRSCKESGEIYDCIQRLTWLRLLDIEDILGDDYDLSRLRALVQADRDGRCVVLPVKIGDSIYFTFLGKIIEKQVFSVVTFCNSQRIYCNGTSEFFRPDDVEKTVFLTRESAEKALKGECNNEEVYKSNS